MQCQCSSPRIMWIDRDKSRWNSSLRKCTCIVRDDTQVPCTFKSMFLCKIFENENTIEFSFSPKYPCQLPLYQLSIPLSNYMFNALFSLFSLMRTDHGHLENFWKNMGILDLSHHSNIFHCLFAFVISTSSVVVWVWIKSQTEG